MAGLVLDMGLGGAAGAGYRGPVFSDGAAAPSSVPGAGGYGDTGRGSIAGMDFGPSGVTAPGMGRQHTHALAFGVFCFGALLFIAWALPR